MLSLPFVSGNLLLRPTFAGPSGHGGRQRDSARGRGLTHEKLTPFLPPPPPLVLPSSARPRPVRLDEAEERRNKRPQNVQLPLLARTEGPKTNFISRGQI